MTEEKRQALGLLKTARGQISGIVNMIEDDRYCVDISKQLLAVQALVKKANLSVLKGHINSCVRNAFLDGDPDEKINEVVSLLDKYMK